MHVNGAGGIAVQLFTITGPGPGPCASIAYGIWVENNGSATIQGNHVTEIRDTPFSGCQNGVGIQIGRKYDPVGGPTVGTATITGNRVDRYQKNGMTVDNTGSKATISLNSVQGASPTPIIAQNGIQVSRGAFATVRSNRVTDNTYSLAPAASSSGILLFGNPPIDASPAPGTTVAQKTTVRNDDNIPAFGTSQVRILDNQVRDSTFFDGIYMG